MDVSGNSLADETVVDLSNRGPGRPPGQAKTGGRPKGAKNRRTKEVEAFLRPALPGAKKRLKALLTSDDEQTAMKAITLVLAYVYGRPVDRREVSGPDGFEVSLSDFEIARRLALVLDSADQDDDDPAKGSKQFADSFQPGAAAVDPGLESAQARRAGCRLRPWKGLIYFSILCVEIFWVLM